MVTAPLYVRAGVLMGALMGITLKSTYAYVCEGTACQPAWWRAQQWLSENARFPIKQINEHRIESSSKTPAHKNRLEYTLIKIPLAQGRQEIVLTGGCRAPIGCPSFEKKRADFERYVSEPGQQPSHNDPQSKGRPVESWAQAHCAGQADIHELRTSWLGVLYELDCQQGTHTRTLHVLRCGAGQCRELK